jgi:hypothetical protein
MALVSVGATAPSARKYIPSVAGFWPIWSRHWVQEVREGRLNNVTEVLNLEVFKRLLDAILGRWKLQGYDVFSDEYYHLPARHWTEALARKAARRYLRSLERMQPSASSGGQKKLGMQDRVFIVRPDGTAYRYLPADWPH